MKICDRCGINLKDEILSSDYGLSQTELCIIKQEDTTKTYKIKDEFVTGNKVLQYYYNSRLDNNIDEVKEFIKDSDLIISYIRYDTGEMEGVHKDCPPGVYTPIETTDYLVKKSDGRVGVYSAIEFNRCFELEK